MPQIVSLGLTASTGQDAGGGSGRAELGGFNFLDANHNPLSGVTYTLVEVSQTPEPANLTAVGVLLLAIGGVWRRRKRQ